MADKKIIAVVSNAFIHTFQATMMRYLEKCRSEDVVFTQVLAPNAPPYINNVLKEYLYRAQPYALIGLCVKPPAEILNLYRKAGVPVVLIDENTKGFLTITSDNEAGGYIAGEYFAKTGRKKPALVSALIDVPGNFACTMRFAGYKKALEQNGLTLLQENIFQTMAYSPAGGREGAEKLLDGKHDIDSVFCSPGDMCAWGFMKVASSRGVKIPEDIAIIGFDDLDVATIVQPSITTIKQNLEKIAEKAYDAVVNDRKKTINSGEIMMLKPEFIKRESA